MNMIGQDADRDSFKRPTCLNVSVGLPEALDLFDQKVARPFGENGRKKRKRCP